MEISLAKSGRTNRIQESDPDILQLLDEFDQDWVNAWTRRLKRQILSPMSESPKIVV